MQQGVQLHTIKELLAAFGEEDDGLGFHVFEKNEKLRKIPVKHPFRSDHFSFFVVTNGSACIKLNLIDYTTQPNTLLIVLPNDLRQFQHISDDCTFMGISFTRDFLGETGIHQKNIDAFDFFSSQQSSLLHLEENETALLLQFFHILLIKNENKTDNYFSREVIQNTFTALIFEIASLFGKRNIPHLKITRNEELAIRFFKLLPQHCREERSLKFYANRLFVSPKYLTQTIKKATGKTAGALIDEMVIMEAKVLLNDLSRSVKQVAEALHFSDQFSFSKFFKKHVQLSPSEYRVSL